MVWSSGGCAVLLRTSCGASVGDFGGELTLTIYDLASDKVPVEEVHSTIASLVSRADALQGEFATAGWELVDVDLDEPD